jgi:hypothetical protein
MPRGKKSCPSNKSHASVQDGAASNLSDPTSYDSIAAAAAGMKLPKSYLRQAKKRGAPGFRGSRVYPGELRPWIEKDMATSIVPDAGGAASLPVEPREQAELRIFLADAVWKEQRNEIQAGRYTKNEIFIEAVEDLANEQRTILRQKLENEYPSVVAGLEPAQARVYGKRVVDECFRLMQQLAERFKRKLTAKDANYAKPSKAPSGGAQSGRRRSDVPTEGKK